MFGKTLSDDSFNQGFHINNNNTSFSAFNGGNNNDDFGQKECLQKLETVQIKLLQIIKDQSKEKLGTIFKLIKNCYEMLKTLEKNMEEEKILLESYVNKNFKELSEIIISNVRSNQGKKHF